MQRCVGKTVQQRRRQQHDSRAYGRCHVASDKFFSEYIYVKLARMCVTAFEMGNRFTANLKKMAFPASSSSNDQCCTLYTEFGEYSV